MKKNNKKFTTLRKLHRDDKFYWKYTRIFGVCLSIIVFIIWIIMIAKVVISNSEELKKAITFANELKEFNPYIPDDFNKMEQFVADLNNYKTNGVNTLLTIANFLKGSNDFIFKITFTIVLLFLTTRIIANIILLIRDFHDYKVHSHKLNLFGLNITKRLVLIVCIVVMMVTLPTFAEFLYRLFGESSNDISSAFYEGSKGFSSVEDIDYEYVKTMHDEGNKEGIEQYFDKFQTELTNNVQILAEKTTVAFNNFLEKMKNAIDVYKGLEIKGIIFALAAFVHSLTVIVLCTTTSIMSDNIVINDKNKKERKSK